VINLLPLTKIIAAISVLYAALIALILFFIYDEKSGVTEGVMVAFSGATFLNLFLFGVISIGWKWLWKKLPSLNQLLFPDLSGEWDMTIHWKRGDTGGKVQAIAYIKQDFLKMSMEVSSEDSDSNTLLAKPQKDPESGRAILYYMYRTTPKLKNGNSSLPYDGTAILKIDHTSFNLLEGNYYTDRSTTGHYELKRKRV
tara:strand:+ start:430 stop:1023 length:594 start_codon:yes stop_codon:yes gene_type:complete